MKEGPGSSLILGPAKGSLVVRQRGVAFLLASVGRADLQLERPNIHSVRYNPVTLAVRSVPTAAGSNRWPVILLLLQTHIEQ
jgi:hypothetical protein